MYKTIPAGYFKIPKGCLEKIINGESIISIPSMPEAKKTQIKWTSRQYFKIIVIANNYCYSFSLRYKNRVEQFLEDVAHGKKNIVLLIDEYKIQAA